MMKAFTAAIGEIDDIEAAVDQLLSQLDLSALGKHSMGIVTCYPEYIDSGVYAAIDAALPFETAGITTIMSGVPGQTGETLLSLMVLTSDEISFSTALSAPIDREDRAPLEAMYSQAAAGLPGAPTMMLSFCPLLHTMGSDFYIETLDALSGGVPNFGTLAIDHNIDYRESQTLHGGQAYKDRYALVLMSGPVAPTFYTGTISDQKIFPQRCVVTAAQGVQLQMVDGKPMIDFLQSIGLQKNEEGTITGINSFSLIVDYNDGSDPVARVMFAVTPEGYAVCGGNIPVGASLSIGSFDPEEIQATTQRTLEQAAAGGHSCLLIFSCVGRYYSQGYETTIEQDTAQRILGPTGARFIMANSGGELCPVYGAGGRSFNRNHNNSIVICAL